MPSLKFIKFPNKALQITSGDSYPPELADIYLKTRKGYVTQHVA